MASDRIGRKSAMLCPLPPHRWEWRTIDWLLEQPVNKGHLHTLPINEPLMENLLVEPMHNPILCLTNYWAIAGGQRMRALQEIKKTKPDFNYEVKVMVFEKDWHNLYYLWGDEESRQKIIGITFQLWELVFKSMWYESDHTDTGVEMTYYEDLGEELKWPHDKKNPKNTTKSTTPKSTKE